MAQDRDSDTGTSAPLSSGAADPPNSNLAWGGDGDRYAGIWWPRTTHAADELALVLPTVSARLGATVTRVSLNIGAWPGDQPRQLLAGGRVVRLGWFNTLDPQVVTFGRSGEDRLALLVAPGSSEDDAREMLRARNGDGRRALHAVESSPS